MSNRVEAANHYVGLFNETVPKYNKAVKEFTIAVEKSAENIGAVRREVLDAHTKLLKFADEASGCGSKGLEVAPLPANIKNWKPTKVLLLSGVVLLSGFLIKNFSNIFGSKTDPLPKA